MVVLWFQLQYYGLQLQVKAICLMDGWKQLYRILKQDPQVLAFVGLVDKSEAAFLAKTPEEFAKDEVHDILAQQMRKINHTALEKAIDKIGTLPYITAKVIKATKSYTLALLIIPPDMVFGWHNHPQMNGISRCVAGELQIRSIDPNKLRALPLKSKKQGKKFAYLQKDLRKEILQPEGESISIIYPATFNIHEIKAGKKQSAFIDLLIPQYPNNDCGYLRTIQDCVEGQELLLEAAHECEQAVVGTDEHIKLLMKQAP